MRSDRDVHDEIPRRRALRARRTPTREPQVVTAPRSRGHHHGEAKPPRHVSASFAHAAEAGVQTSGAATQRAQWPDRSLGRGQRTPSETTADMAGPGVLRFQPSLSAASQAGQEQGELHLSRAPTLRHQGVQLQPDPVVLSPPRGAELIVSQRHAKVEDHRPRRLPQPANGARGDRGGVGPGARAERVPGDREQAHPLLGDGKRA